MTEGASVVIVGGGIIGLSTAWALTERGLRDVLVLERDVIGSGGTGRSSGVVRCHYGVPELVSMAWRSLPVLAGSQEILGGESGYRRTGYLVAVGEDNVESLKANVAMQSGLGVEVELVDHRAAAQLWPTARLDDFAAFAYEPLGGYGDGHQTAMTFAAAARRGGARIRQGSPVVAIVEKSDRVAGVELATGEFIGTEQVIVASGAWSVPLASTVGIDLPIRPQRARILVVDPGPVVLGMVPVLSDLVSLQYVRMEGTSSLLVGDSDHSDPEWVDDPGEASTPPEDDLLSRSIAKFDHRFPGLDSAALRSSYSGVYDVTPDYNPIISLTPLDGLLVLAGFSGHGFKISPGVGQLAADLAVQGRSSNEEIDETVFRLSRFADGDLLTSLHSYIGAGQMR